MVEQAIYSRSAQILTKLSAQSGTDIFTLYEPGVVTPWDTVNTTRYYGFITDLRLKVDINSLTESEIPALEITSSRSERVAAIREMEWGSPRKEFHLYLETSRHPKTVIAAVSLLNRQPYYHVNLLPYLTDNGVVNVANDARILGRIVNVGWGVLQGNDEVVCFGSVKEEVTTLPETIREIQYSQPYAWTINTNSVPILPSNPNRLQLTLVNRGSSGKIYLNYGGVAQIGGGICLLPNGGSYEINLSNPYAGLITAISDTNGAQLSGLECV